MQKAKAVAPFGAAAFLYVENASGAERNCVGAGLRLTLALSAACRCDSSREKVNPENPQIFRICKYKNNFSAIIATATTTACGQRLPPAGGRCRIATKEGMQGGAVGAVASRMQGPLKGRSSRWVPQLVQSEAETILNQILLNAPSQNPPARLRRSGGAPVSAPASHRIPGGTVPGTTPAPAAVRCRSPSKSRTSRW